MMLNLFLSIAAPLAAGLLLVRLAWRPGAGIHTCVLQFVLGSGLAVGISSCTFFLWLARPFSMGIQFAVAEPVFLFCAVAACLAFKKPRRAVLTNLLPAPVSLRSPKTWPIRIASRNACWSAFMLSLRAPLQPLYWFSSISLTAAEILTESGTCGQDSCFAGTKNGLEVFPA